MSVRLLVYIVFVDASVHKYQSCSFFPEDLVQEAGFGRDVRITSELFSVATKTLKLGSKV